MSQDTNVENLIINKLTKAQYESITNPDPTQLYFITDEVISSSDVVNALGYTPYNSTNPSGYITSADLPTVDQTYDATSANAQSGVAIAGAGFLKNTATGLYSISVDGNATTKNHAINIGFNSTSDIASIAIGSNSTSGSNGISLGSQAKAGSFCVAIGSNAKTGTSVVNAIQLGSNSTNTESNTFYVSFNGSNEALGLNYKLLDGTTGLIPDARISSNIQRTLVSGTNIKTINNNSILGSGNLTLDGLPTQTGQGGKFLTTDGTDASWADIPLPTYDDINERITW